VLWLLSQSRNHHAQELDRVEQHLTQQLVKEGNKVNQQAIIVDPGAFDAARAIGFTPTQAAALASGALPPAAGSPQEAWYAATADAMLYSHKTSLGSEREAAGPQAQSRFMGGAACMIVPEDQRSEYINIKKMTPDEEMMAISLHEAWHCRDDVNTFAGIPPETIDKVSKIHRVQDLPDDPAARRAFAGFNRMESLADVGAMGDMIRNGSGLSIIGAAREWRKEKAWDAAHHTVQSLDGLQREIEKMGVEKFRKLDDAAARKLYLKVIDENALTEKSVDIIYRDKHSMLRSFLNDNIELLSPDIRKARNFQRSLEGTVNGPGLIQRTMEAIGRVMSGEDKKDAKMAAEVDKWDAMGELKDTAFKNDGKITPATMVSAYRDMQDRLCEDTRKHPEKRKLNEAKMMKLHDLFVDETPKTDFAAENLKRGVKIELAEPALKDFIVKPKPAVAAAQPAKPAI
jgi:hypothetical protein